MKSNMKPLVAVMLAGALGTALLAGCSNTGEDETPFKEAPANAPKDAAGRPAPKGLEEAKATPLP